MSETNYNELARILLEQINRRNQLNILTAQLGNHSPYQNNLIQRNWLLPVTRNMTSGSWKNQKSPLFGNNLSNNENKTEIKEKVEDEPSSIGASGSESRSNSRTGSVTDQVDREETQCPTSSAMSENDENKKDDETEIIENSSFFSG